jgi:hypothetical protein
MLRKKPPESTLIAPEEAPDVQAAVELVRRRRAALAQAKDQLTAAERLLAAAEAEALAQEDLVDLSAPRQAVEQAQHLVAVRQRGIEDAMVQGAAAYRQAAAAHYQALWARYQSTVNALIESLRAASALGETVRAAYRAVGEAAHLAGVEAQVLPRADPGLGHTAHWCDEQERTILSQAAPTTPIFEAANLGRVGPDYPALFAKAMGEDAIRTGYTRVRFRSAAELEARGLSARPYAPGELASFPEPQARQLIDAGAAVAA